MDNQRRAQSEDPAGGRRCRLARRLAVQSVDAESECPISVEQGWREPRHRMPARFVVRGVFSAWRDQPSPEPPMARLGLCRSCTGEIAESQDAPRTWAEHDSFSWYRTPRTYRRR